MDELLREYRELYLATADARAKLAKLESAIKSEVRELGKGVEGDGVSVTYRPGNKRVSWDGKALDGFAAAHPEILVFRKESVTSPVVSIKVKGD